MQSEIDIDENVSVDENKEIKKRKKRQVFFFCANIIDEKLVLEQVPITMEEEINLEKSKQEVIDLFKSKYGVLPSEVRGPVLDYKGIGNIVTAKKQQVDIMTTPSFSGKRSEGIHSVKNVDWNVIVNYTTDPDIVYVLYTSPIQNVKMQKPSPSYIRLSLIKDIKTEL